MSEQYARINKYRKDNGIKVGRPKKANVGLDKVKAKMLQKKKADALAKQINAPF